MIPEDGCCSVRFTAVQRGHTTVTASYTSRGKELSASVTIAAYDPLMVKTCNLAFNYFCYCIPYEKRNLNYILGILLVVLCNCYQTKID